MLEYWMTINLMHKYHNSINYYLTFVFITVCFSMYLELYVFLNNCLTWIICESHMWASQVELVVKNLPACLCRRHKRRGFDPWVVKIPWRRAWPPTPVFLPGEYRGLRSLTSYHLWCRRVRQDWSWLSMHAHTTHIYFLKFSNFLFYCIFSFLSLMLI